MLCILVYGIRTEIFVGKLNKHSIGVVCIAYVFTVLIFGVKSWATTMERIIANRDNAVGNSDVRKIVATIERI